LTCTVLKGHWRLF